MLRTSLNDPKALLKVPASLAEALALLRLPLLFSASNTTLSAVPRSHPSVPNPVVLTHKLRVRPNEGGGGIRASGFETPISPCGGKCAACSDARLSLDLAHITDNPDIAG